MRELIEHTEGINRLMARYGVKFGIYKGGEFMGRETDYYKDREEITPEKAHAKLGKEVMTPADYVPLVREYQKIWVDKKPLEVVYKRYARIATGF